MLYKDANELAESISSCTDKEVVIHDRNITISGDVSSMRDSIDSAIQDWIQCYITIPVDMIYNVFPLTDSKFVLRV
jgi:ABC-type transporter Mla maintaining outer membrane lipid asymmetry ATPase subunit MlaF